MLYVVSWCWENTFPPLSAGLKQQNGHLTQVEVNEMLGLMSHVAAKVPPDDAVPGWVILLVELLGGTGKGKTVQRLRHCLDVRYKVTVLVFFSLPQV